MNLHPASIETADGDFTAWFSARGLARLDFPGAVHARAPIKLMAGRVGLTDLMDGWLRLTRNALAEALAGRAPAALPPLDWSVGTEFQCRVWAALQRIGPGETRTYGEVAAAIRRPKATRAVGGACGANPIPVLVPCHRVLAHGGRLGGFSSGLDWKRRLLAREGVILPGLGS